MELSIIVTSYRSSQLLKLCLDSIKTTIKTPYELIVADSATQEDTTMMMREEYPEITFFDHPTNVGFQSLVRRGIEASSGEYILLLNGDILVTPSSVEKILEFIKKHTDIGMIGPGLLNFNGTLQDSCFRYYKPQTIIYRRTLIGSMPFAKKHLEWFLMKDYDHKKPSGVDWLMGSAMLLRRKALDSVGFMDPMFFMYMEDVDWCRRFWEKGFKVVYYPEARMYHYHGKQSAKGGVLHSLLLNRLTWVHIISGIKYFKKYWGKPAPNTNATF